MVVDDGSTDCTAAAGRARPGATVLRHPFNLGIGGAVQSGYRYACDNGYELAVQVDGDGQHDPAEIAAPDARDGRRTRWTWSAAPASSRTPATAPRRRGGSGSGCSPFVLSRIVRQRVTDPTSGFRLCNRRAIELFARDYPHDYPEVEAILMMHAHRLRMREVPVRMHERRGGRSSITSGESAYYMVKVLLAIFVGLFRRRPGASSPGARRRSCAERGI